MKIYLLCITVCWLQSQCCRRQSLGRTPCEQKLFCLPLKWQVLIQQRDAWLFFQAEMHLSVLNRWNTSSTSACSPCSKSRVEFNVISKIKAQLQLCICSLVSTSCQQEQVPKATPRSPQARLDETWSSVGQWKGSLPLGWASRFIPTFHDEFCGSRVLFTSQSSSFLPHRRGMFSSSASGQAGMAGKAAQDLHNPKTNTGPLRINNWILKSVLRAVRSLYLMTDLLT